MKSQIIHLIYPISNLQCILSRWQGIVSTEKIMVEPKQTTDNRIICKHACNVSDASSGAYGWARNTTLLPFSNDWSASSGNVDSNQSRDRFKLLISFALVDFSPNALTSSWSSSKNAQLQTLQWNKQMFFYWSRIFMMMVLKECKCSIFMVCELRYTTKLDYIHFQSFSAFRCTSLFFEKSIAHQIVHAKTYTRSWIIQVILQ